MNTPRPYLLFFILMNAIKMTSCGSSSDSSQYLEHNIVGSTLSPVSTEVVPPINTSIDENIHSNIAQYEHALFVSSDGSDQFQGLTPETAFKTINKALRAATPGDTIYIKAGHYKNAQLTFNLFGKQDKPITIEGYTTIPGDRPSNPTFDHQSPFNVKLMPLLTGDSRSQGRAINLDNQQHIIIRSLQITNYKEGIVGKNAQNIEVHNVYLSRFGANKKDFYDGHGIKFYPGHNSNILIKDSVIRNAGAENIFLSGEYNHIDNVKSFGTEASENNPTDYYIVVFGNNNIIENSYAKRFGNLTHGGHGIGLKGNCNNNILRNNIADGFRNSAFYLRHRGVKNNLLQGNTSLNSEMGLTFRDGASGNIVENHYTENTKYAINFFDTKEDGGKQFSANDNIIRSSRFINTKYSIINYSDYIYTNVYASRNVFKNNLFDIAPYLFTVKSSGKSNLMRKNVLRNIKTFAKYNNHKKETDIGFTFIDNTIENSRFILP